MVRTQLGQPPLVAPDTSPVQDSPARDTGPQANGWSFGLSSRPGARRAGGARVAYLSESDGGPARGDVLGPVAVWQRHLHGEAAGALGPACRSRSRCACRSASRPRHACDGRPARPSRRPAPQARRAPRAPSAGGARLPAWPRVVSVPPLGLRCSSPRAGVARCVMSRCDPAGMPITCGR